MSEDTPENDRKYSFARTGPAALGAVILAYLSTRSAKGLSATKPQTQEEIENGQEPQRRSVGRRIVNGLLLVAEALGMTTMAMDAIQGEKVGTNLKEMGKYTRNYINQLRNRGQEPEITP